MRKEVEEIVNANVYRALVENGSDVHIICDITGTPRYVSPTIYKVLGYTEAEALTLTPEDFFHPDDIIKVTRIFTECLQNPVSYTSAPALRVKGKNSQWIWIEASLSNMLHDTEVNGIIFNFRDISDRKKAQIQLLKSQLFNKSVLSSLTSHIAVIDETGLIISVNKAWDNFAVTNGGSSATATSNGSNYFAVCEKAAESGDEIASEALLGIKSVLNGETDTFTLEYPCHSPHEQRWFVLRATSVGQSQNRVVLSHQNVTEQKLARIELSESERRFRGLIENSTDGIVILSSEGNPTYVSPSVKNLLGYSIEESMALNLFEITHPDDLPAVELLINKCFQNPGIPTKSAPTRIRHKNGEWRWMEGTITNMFDDPAINGIVDNFWDVTEQRLAEKKVLHANRLYAFLSQINQAILRTKNDQTLFAEACRVAVEVGKFKTAWIGLFNHEKEKIHLVASYGAPEDAVKVFSDFTFKKDGPIHKVVNGEDFATRHIKAEHTPEWNKLVSDSNYQSAIVLAIKRSGKLIGAFNIYSIETDYFDDQEVQLLLESTSEISSALSVFEKDRLRTETEQALKESERRLNEAQAVAKLGSWEIDLVNLSVSWSAEAYRIFETDVFNGTYEGFMRFVHPDDREKVDNAFTTSLQDNRDSFVEHRIIAGNGEHKTICENWTFYRDINGVPLRAIGTSQDITKQKQSEEDSRFKADLLNTIGQAAVAIDLNGVITYWNRAAEDIYGWSESEAVGRKIITVIPYVVPKAKATELAEGLQEGRVWSGELDVRRKDGSIIPVLVTDSPIYDEHNRLIGSIAISSDISEKKELQQRLNSANFLAKIGSFEVDLKNNSLYWSEITKEIHEVTGDFVPDVETAIDFYKEGPSRTQIRNALEEAITKGTPYDLDLQIITARGNEKWVRAIGQAEFKDGTCVRVYGSFQDINKLKQAQIEALRAYKERNNILESFGEGFFAVDKNWIVTYWNNKAEQFLGKTKQQALNNNLWELFPDAVGTPFHDYYHQAVEKDHAQHFEAHYEGLNMWVEVSCYPTSDGLAVYFKDISARKQQDLKLLELNRNLQKYTEELIISNKGLEQFSYIISHNLRSPAANIMGLANEMNNPLHDGETKNLLLAELISNVTRLDNVIVDLNSILQAKSQINELKEPLQLTRLISDISQSIQNIIDKERVKILTADVLVDDFFTIKSYLYSILYNLISNAIKYRRADADPVIRIKSSEKSGKLYISIKDNGKGIDLSRQKDHVFGLYKRFHPEIEGKGMGLFMVKTQVEVLGGKIFIKSEVNKGTEFIIEFKI